MGVLCWSLFYNASICVLSIFVNTLTRKRMIVALLKLSSWCLVTVSVLFLFLTIRELICSSDFVFPVYTHLLFAYLVSSYCNECFIHSIILD